MEQRNAALEKVPAAARQIETVETMSIGAALSLIRERGTKLALLGVLLALIMAAWLRPISKLAREPYRYRL